MGIETHQRKPFVVLLFLGYDPVFGQITKTDPDCTITLKNIEWKGKAPALILKTDRSKVITGKIIKIEDNGVIFDPERESIFYDSLISNDFALGIDLSYLVGRISDPKLNGDIGVINAEEKMDRFDFNIRLRLFR